MVTVGCCDVGVGVVTEGSSVAPVGCWDVCVVGAGVVTDGAGVTIVGCSDPCVGVVVAKVGSSVATLGISERTDGFGVALVGSDVVILGPAVTCVGSNVVKLGLIDGPIVDDVGSGVEGIGTTVGEGEAGNFSKFSSLPS